MTRVPLRCGWSGGWLAGTLHAPPDDAPEPVRRLALLLLNGGPAPRAGNGDLSVHIADRLAARGLRAFRFDLPGLGDSSGASYRDVDSYWAATLRGANDAAVAALVLELCRRYALHGLLVGGLCSGAVCAIRASESSRDSVAGLLLLEPEFGTSPLPGPRVPALARALVRRIGHAISGGENTALVASWVGSLRRGTPSLAIVAEGLASDAAVTRIVGEHAELSDALRCERIEGTNHLLTAGNARTQVVAHVERWFEERFADAKTCVARQATGANGVAAFVQGRP